MDKENECRHNETISKSERKKTVICATSWKNLDDIAFIEISQLEEDKCMIPSLYKIKHRM